MTRYHLVDEVEEGIIRTIQEKHLRYIASVALRQHNLPSRVFMLLKSTLVIESVLMSPVRTNLPQSFKFFSLILESHSTIEGVISPMWWEMKVV